MELTTGQQNALDKLTSWNGRGQFVLKGAAGTGKSVLMSTVLPLLLERFSAVQLMAPTAKAALRLKEVTGADATTIHSAIYQPYLKDGELRFGTRTDALMSGQIAIVDEASMVTQWMARDLEKCFRGILYIGDHFQLPPVKADDWFGAQAADVELKEVMRQALESPVLSLVTAIRNGLPIPTTCSSDELVIKSTSNVNDLLGVDQVVCATNATRISLNELIRSKLGRSGSIQIGDRLINLRNVPSPKGIVCNGQQGMVAEVEGKKLIIQWDDGREFSSFGTMDPEEFESKGAGKNGDWLYLDFAYCITAHKAQGSQWPSVLVYDDSGYMKTPGDRRRWQYTAGSRAQQKLVWIRKT
jgi:exodeoxyribonuclease-5